MSNEQSSIFGRVSRSTFTAAIAAVLLVLAAVAPAHAVAGPTKLSDPDVAPRTAVPGTTITFAVTYRNREGSPPDEVRVTIGTTAYLMAPASSDANWKAGVRFTFATTVPVGIHAVTFSGMDRERFTDQVDGGSVTIAVPSTPAPTPVPTPTPYPPGAPPAPTATPAPTLKPTAPAASVPAATPPAPGPTGTPVVDDLAPGSTGGASTGGSPGGATDVPRRATDEPDDEEPGGNGGSPPGEPPTDSPAAPGSGPGGGDSPGAGSGAGGRGTEVIPSSGWGAFARALEALGVDAGRSPLLQVLPTVVTSAGGVTLVMAFMFFGKKRRDGEPPAPDEVLQARAARGDELPSATALVPDTPRAPLDPELQMPRWRRPSLLEARKKDPLRDTNGPPPRLSFDHGLVGPVDGAERRLIRYNVVRLLDAPDELRSAEIGFLDQGDEVQLLERSGAYWHVLCPDGRRGWLHKMTLGDVVGAPAAPGPRETWGTNASEGTDPGIDDDVLTAFLTARGRA